jgi:hypothetical protein
LWHFSPGSLLLIFVRKKIINNCSSGNWTFSYNFRSSSCVINRSLPSHDVLLRGQVYSLSHPRQGFNFTYQFKHWWIVSTFYITHSVSGPHVNTMSWVEYFILLSWVELSTFGECHSPITFSNLSPLNIVSIFRCPSPPRNLVYVSRADPSVLAFSLLFHRQPYISTCQCRTIVFRLGFQIPIGNENHNEISQIRKRIQSWVTSTDTVWQTTIGQTLIHTHICPSQQFRTRVFFQGATSGETDNSLSVFSRL